MSVLCLCGSGVAYHDCCRPYHQGKAAPTAEALMRSRYVAYCRRDGMYLHRTWSQLTRPSKASLLSLSPTQWVRLEVGATHLGGVDDTEGKVAFVAYFIDAVTGEEMSMHEVSLFMREKGRWVYASAVQS